jgi:nucleotide-binding universal stress UspA family protein
VYRRAIVPLDGSAVAETILPVLVDMAAPLDLEIVLLRVVQPTPPVVMEASRHVLIDDAATRQAEALDYLAPLAADLRDRGVRTLTRVRRGQPADEILAAQREEQADLIAMSTHGRSGLGRLVFGSVAEDVLRRASVPVLLLRATAAEVARRAAQEAAQEAAR